MSVTVAIWLPSYGWQGQLKFMLSPHLTLNIHLVESWMGFARRKALQWNLGSMLHGQQLIETRGRACHDCARWGIWCQVPGGGFGGFGLVWWGILWVENHLGRLGNKTFPFYQPGSLWRGFNTEGSLVGGYGRRLCEVSTNHCSNGSSAVRSGLNQSWS